MDDLSAQITQILNDPGRLQQIMALASTLGGQAGQETPQDGPPEMVENISKLLQQAEKRDQKQEALVRALRPYLKPDRQARLQQAMQIAHLSHLAGAAFRAGGKEPEKARDGQAGGE